MGKGPYRTIRNVLHRRFESGLLGRLLKKLLGSYLYLHGDWSGLHSRQKARELDIGAIALFFVQSASVSDWQLSVGYGHRKI